MKSILALLVIAAFACSMVEMKKPKPWEIRNKLRDMMWEIKDAVDDIADEECM